MLKTRKKWISLLVVLAFLLTLLPAGAVFAGASSYKTVTTIEKFDPTKVTAPVKSALVEVKIAPAVTGLESKAWVEVLDAEGGRLDVNSVVYQSSVGVADFTYSVASDKSRIELSITPSGSPAKVYFYVYFDGKDCPAGDVVLNFFNTTGQLDPGKLVVATATGGQVEVAVLSVPTIGEDEGKQVTFRLTQSAVGALNIGTGSVKIKLPSGFKWTNAGPSTGNVDARVDTSSSRLLLVNVTNNSSTVNEVYATVEVDDPDVAKMGDVVATVEGGTVEGGNTTSVTPSEITVAKYAEYGVDVTIASVKELLAGKLNDQKTDLIKIKEKLAGTLIPGRKITVELPEWVKIVDYSDQNSTFGTVYSSISDNKLTLKVPDSRSSSKYTIEFKLMLSIEAARSGDIEAVVKGAGIPETKVVVAKVVPPITVSATPADVKIGVQDQAAPDVTITEAKAGAIKGNKVILSLPEGVKFAGTPTVKVTAGDLEIKTESVKVVDDRQLEIPVKAESIKASTITVTGIKLSLDRTVPEGALTVKVKGDAVVDNSGDGAGKFLTDYAAKFVLANCVTPAPGETKGVAVFKINDTKYVLNGKEVTMDVAPYIKDGRTMVPVRFAANAVGVSDANILWDGLSKKVTVIKGDRVVQMTIGSKVLLLNGAPITMDVAPEIKNGRTMLPVSWLGKVLGADIQWNPETQEVTINF